MKSLTPEQCIEVNGAGTSVRKVLESAIVGAAGQVVGTYALISATVVSGVSQMAHDQILKYSLAAGGLYFVGYVGGSIYASYYEPTQTPFSQVKK